MSRARPTFRVLASGLVAGLVIGISGGLVGLRPWERGGPPPCPAIAAPTGMSVARRWDEALLNAIRRSIPNPPVHARNLFHLSVAMWDAWAAYDPTASGYLFREKVSLPRCADVMAPRNEAISYAAYRVLSSRFLKAVGADQSLSEFANLMDSYQYSTSITATEGDTPAAIGNRIAKMVLDYGIADGSNEANGYVPPDYKPVNPPLVVARPGITMVDPNRWQPLEIANLTAQNGVVLASGVQTAVGPHWGHVKPFAIPDGGAAGAPFDPGPQPRFGDPATDATFRSQAVEVIRDSALLDPANDQSIDISPAAIGANDLGTNNGHGRPTNPVTGKPYAQDLSRAGDFYRSIAEFWADGPNSETPPGHWNVIANEVSDELAPNLRLGGNGPVLDRLEWDVKMYLAVNGAVHDAAIAAWGLKGHYDGVRPISMIRYMAMLGQSSDPALPAYNKEGLPLVPGLIELITPDKTAPGGPMAELRGSVGKIAVRTWQRSPTPGSTGRTAWILGTIWTPYQGVTFVTPSFPGYISGHSTFSRAAAEVMASFTGSPFFPGGLAEHRIAKGSFRIEPGPSADVVLQWATYYDAADQAGQSRLFGGIHVQADDFTGRVVGSTCGKAAWDLAQRYYKGLATR